MTKAEIEQIQKQGYFDVGRLLSEEELRELAYLETGSSCFTWGDILDYVSINALEYSIDFIEEAQVNYAKEYAEEKHTSKANGMKAARKCTANCLISIIRKGLMRTTLKSQFELMKKLHREDYLKFFE